MPKRWLLRVSGFVSKQRPRIASSIVGLASIITVCVSHPGCQGGRGRQELISFEKQLHIGQTEQDVKSLFQRNAFEHLTLVEGEEKDGTKALLVQTPAEFGAGNWVLWLRFSEGSLVRIAVREEDSETSRPPDAPPDRVK
jgi:hypothetical protein